MNTGKLILSTLYGAMAISSASASVAYVNCDEFWSSSFENGAIEPYYECTFKRPAYINGVNLDGQNCAEAWWSAAGYDGSRLDRGMEACSGDSTTELRFREDGWYGLKIRFPSDAYPTDKNCIVLQMFAHGRGGSWAGTLIVNDNRLSIEHRHWLTQNITVHELDADIERDTWIPIIIHFKPSTNPSKGKMQVWYDGAPQDSPSYDFTGTFAFDGIDTNDDGQYDDDGWVDDDTMKSGIGLKWGMYCADSANYTPNETRTIYYDDVTQLKGNPVGAWQLVNPEADGRDAFSRIDAEYYSDQSGVVMETCTDTEGGFALVDLQDSDWVACYDVNFGDGAKEFQARVASANGGTIEVRLDSPTGTLLGSCPVGNTGGVERWETVSADITTISGKQTIYLKFTGGSGDLLSLNWFSFIGNELLPLIEKTQAEEYLSQSGTSLEACGDTGGGSNVAYISHGDWCQYNEVVPGAGGIFRARVARPNNKPDSAIEVRLGDSDGTLIATVDVPETGGWQTYHTIETDLPAVTGQYPLYLKFVETGAPGGSSIFNINWFELERTPVEYEAEDYAAQNGTTLESCGDTGGGTNVANISNGNWCRYDNLFLGDDAVFRARIARPAGRADGQIEIRANDLSGTLLGTLDVPETGGWQTYETIEEPLTVTSGTYSIVLKFVDVTSGGGSLFNVNRFSITPSSKVIPPENVTAQAVTSTQIDLEWQSRSNATRYNLKRSNRSGGPYLPLVSDLSEPNYSDLGVLAGTNYTYVATALYGSAESGYSLEVSAVPSAPIDPDDVVIGAIDVGTNGSGALSFSLSIESSGLGHLYQVYTSEFLMVPDWQPSGDVVSGTGDELVFEIPMNTADTNGYYRLEAWRQ